MKKVGMLCLSILVLCWGLLGCTNGEEIPSASGVSSETASEEGGPVVICADESFREDLKELISYLQPREMKPNMSCWCCRTTPRTGSRS